LCNASRQALRQGEMAKYIIAHDVGTSGNKAVLVDTEGRVHDKCFEPYQTYYPSPGCVEQEPETSLFGQLGASCQFLLY
jgi:glycerol kinase